MTEFRAVSLFSNCGAGDVGFRRAGFHFVVLAELDPRRLAVAELNHPDAVGVEGDLRQTWRRVVRKYLDAEGSAPLDLLAACPPCQGMSSARGRRGTHDLDEVSADARNLLVVPIAKVAAKLRPRVIVVENVPAFLTRQVRHPRTRRPISAASLLVQLLRRRYEVFPFVADLADFGVPQTRKRAFLTFVRRDEPGLAILRSMGAAPYPRPTHDGLAGRRAPIALDEALRRMRLPSLDASNPELARDVRRPLHMVPVWPGHRYAMVAAIPSGTGGSAWVTSTCGACGAVARDAEAATCPSCGAALPRPVVRDQATGELRLISGFRSSSYRRMAPDRPASTITTASGHVGSHRTLHPFEHRVLSPLECAELQTFPRSFNWGDALEEWGHTAVRQMIGEAVPPHFTRRHGRALARVLAPDASRTPLLSTSDARCRKAVRQLELAAAARVSQQGELSLDD